MMHYRIILLPALILGFSIPCVGQDKPVELEILKQNIGVWDAEIEAWPNGPDKESIKFKGVETNRAYGEYWMSSDFDSVFMGQTMKIHLIVGYDLDQKKLVGTIIDHGPYSASMSGKYDPKTKTIAWVTKAKFPDGKPMVQNTVVTQKSDDVRVLVLNVPSGDGKKETIKSMQITYTKRKKK